MIIMIKLTRERLNLNLINNWQGEGESIIIIRRDSWDGVGQVRRIGIGRLRDKKLLVDKIYPLDISFVVFTQNHDVLRTRLCISI